MSDKQKRDGAPEDSSVQRSTRGTPEDQTPAIKHPGQYAADELGEQQQGSGESGQSTEGAPNQGTESR